MTVLLTAWITSGVCLWFAGLQHNGFPRRWRGVEREDGWLSLLGVYLPLCIAGGPLLWLVLVYNEWSAER